MEFTKLPLYDVAKMEKVPYGTTKAKGHGQASIALHGDEVMKADGSVFMYATENDPEQRGTIVGFDKRFIAMPLRNKAVAAIIPANTK